MSDAQTSRPVDSSLPGKVEVPRPFRAKLRGSVLILIRLPNRRQVRAAIHQLSTTGGVVHLESPLDEKIEVELLFHINNATIRSKGQMLFPMWATQGWLQPFRFTKISETCLGALEGNLKSFVTELANVAGAGR